MTTYIGDYNPRLRRRATGLKVTSCVVAVVVVAAYPMSMVINDVWPKGWEILGVVGASLCGVLFFAGIPWLGYITAKRQAEQVLYLNGTELTVVGLIKKAPNTFDLTRTRAEVMLIGGAGRYATYSGIGPLGSLSLSSRVHQLKRRPSKNRPSFFVPFHPVLVLYREDGHAFPIELCYVVSGQLRDSDEIIALERAMQFATDPGIQHAAGQLRTVAKWQRLPEITDAEADAIPATPLDHPYGAPDLATPVRAGTPSPEIQVVPQA